MLPENTMADAERWAAGIPGPAYAIDDDTAIKVTDGTVEVISEGTGGSFPPSRRRQPRVSRTPSHACERVPAAQRHLSFLLALRMVAVAGGWNGCHERQARFWDPFQGSNGAAAAAFLAGFVVLPRPSVDPARAGHQPVSRETAIREARRDLVYRVDR